MLLVTAKIVIEVKPLVLKNLESSFSTFQRVRSPETRSALSIALRRSILSYRATAPPCATRGGARPAVATLFIMPSRRVRS